MKVRLTTSRATADGAWDAGEIIDVDPEEAKRLLESGSAEPVAEKRSDKRETRVKEPV